MRLTLTRHGETIENTLGIHQGQTVPGTLSSKGVAEAEELAEQLKNERFSAIFVSPLNRVKETADIVLRHHQYVSAIEEHALKPKDSKAYDGKPRELIYEDSKRLGVPVALIKTKDGESIADLQARTARFLERLKSEGYENVLLIAHGDVIATMLLAIHDKHMDSSPEFVPKPSETVVVEI